MAETLDVLKKLGKSVARGVPQLATGFVDLAALPLTMTGVRKPEQIFGSTAYLTDKGLLPQPQTGLLNEGAELASSMLNPAAAAKGATVGLLGTFIGKGSKLWNAESNSIAKALEKEGLAPETIWSQTGNVKAPDGKWRQEISDADATIKAQYDPQGNYYHGGLYPDSTWQTKNVENLSGMLEHPKLFEAYPEAKNIEISQMSGSPWLKSVSGADSGASFTPKQNNIPNRITLYDDRRINPDITKSSLLHETAHYIQEAENMGRGGSPLKYDAMQQTNLSPEEAFKQYQRTLGEAEARLTQRRMNLSPEQRLQYYPYAQGQYGLDVPYGELIVQGLLK